MADPFGQLSDREILVQIASQMSDVRGAVFGDKRPGLIDVVARHGQRLDEYDLVYARQLEDSKPILAKWEDVKRDVESLKSEGVTGKERKTMWATMLTSLGIALAGFLSAWNAAPK